MFRTIRGIPSLDLRGWVIEINGELIGPVFARDADAQRVCDWLTAAATELDLLFNTHWTDTPPPGTDEENLDSVS